MDSDVTAGVVVVLFTLAFVALAFVLSRQRKCVTCGEIHKDPRPERQGMRAGISAHC